MATFVRTGSYNNCVIKVHGKQYFNGYENTEEELDNVPLKSLENPVANFVEIYEITNSLFQQPLLRTSR